MTGETIRNQEKKKLNIIVILAGPNRRHITKTRLFKYTENFFHQKMKIFR